MDHYATLGVSKNSSQEEIKQAYRKLAAKHHPDRGGDTKTFQQIQAAYDALSDPEKRSAYDNPHHEHFGGGFDSINDIFNSMFNMRNFTNVQMYNFAIHLSLEDILVDSVKTLQINTPQGMKYVEINVPKGIDHGQAIRYENVIPNASLQITFLITEHLKFRRHGLDLHSVVPINVFDLIIGTKIQFTALDGTNLEITIRPNTKPEYQLRIPGRGLKNNSRVGDQYILIKAEIPDNISDELLLAINNERNQTRKDHNDQ
jgi:DnaJ-class molecular chaperone